MVNTVKERVYYEEKMQVGLPVDSLRTRSGNMPFSADGMDNKGSCALCNHSRNTVLQKLNVGDTYEGCFNQKSESACTAAQSSF